MHTLTLVLLSPGTVNLWGAASDLLRPHRIVDGEVKPATRMDYWGMGEGTIQDEQSAMSLGVADDETLATNVCFVSRLPADFIPGAVVTPDGKWHDLADFGWRLISSDSKSNIDAEMRWANEVKKIFAEHKECIAVEFDTHF